MALRGAISFEQMPQISRFSACPYLKHSRSASLCFFCSLLRMHCVSLHPALRALNFVPRSTFVQLRVGENGFCQPLLTEPIDGSSSQVFH